jgi:hypothetical protein
MGGWELFIDALYVIAATAFLVAVCVWAGDQQ